MLHMKITRLLTRTAGLSINTRRSCPICSWKGKQFSIGGASSKVRFDCICPRCGSAERHRLAYMVATSKLDLDYSSVLHVAPERALKKFLQSRSDDYLSIDLCNPAMIKMDITELELDDQTKSLVWISHVLEHIERDDLAISEIYRVLIPSGIAFVQVPIWRETTFEDSSIKSAQGRTESFFQRDHVRLYGLDIMDRFKLVGFDGILIRAQDFGPEKVLEHGLSFVSTNEVFIFRKQ